MAIFRQGEKSKFLSFRNGASGEAMVKHEQEMVQAWRNAQTHERNVWVGTNQPEEYFIQSWQSLLDRAPLIRNSLQHARAVLDVACGGVPILHVLSPTELMVAADPLNPDFANLYPRKPWIKYVPDTAEKLPYEDSTFDVVFCMNALDHMLAPCSAVRQMLRVLKPSGWLHMDVTNSSPLVRLLVKAGYRRHLSEFHPHMLTLRSVCSWLEDVCEIVELDTSPSVTFRKVLYGVRVLLGKQHLDPCQQQISTLSLPRGRALAHAAVNICDSLLYNIDRRTFAYLGRIAARKKNPKET